MSASSIGACALCRDSLEVASPTARSSSVHTDVQRCGGRRSPVRSAGGALSAAAGEEMGAAPPAVPTSEERRETRGATAERRSS